MPARPDRPQDHRPRGYTLLEVMVVLTLMGVLFSLSAPSFRRAIEQAKADIAGANLRAIWAAQRLYWLDNRTYAPDLATLGNAGLLDPTLVAPASGAAYTYAIDSAGASTFGASAARTGDAGWTGTLSIDQTGAVTGSVQGEGQAAISPGYQ
jgi:prepilin-type N-terminal cleavage/methylation domain-containing protein